MGLYKILLVIFLQIYGIFGTMTSLVYFNETGKLFCNFPNSQNLSWNELVIFWQDQDMLVLFDLLQGIEQPKSVNSKYKGRTSFDRDSWTLKLHNVQIQDKGTYTCFIHHKKPGGMIPLFQMNSELSVRANFSQPEITPISNRTEHSDTVNLTCSSTNGYPEPTRMWFLIEPGNISMHNNSVMKKSQNNVTKLYTVSISASFPIGTESVNIFCVLQHDQMMTELRSLSYKIDPVQLPPAQDFFHWIVAAIVTLAVVFLMVFLILMKNRKKPGPSYERETIQVEAEEKEQLEERVRCYVPERSDEAQCVIKVSKTASGDKSATDT
ncbi:T-lymphocyte activation antigen CD86 [Sorex araneus]|uniref:T-lymphocyte activation antigen CD86 n=1 Tax=Sorex araneus TaxID=42254 RepID=UPI0024340088|nr:T-lymphocyte activation antigen CD86 [Sorex araneus]